MARPSPETHAELLKVWEAWLSPKSRWLKALRTANTETIFHNWGGGLPGKNGLLPFCMEATLRGETRPIERICDVEALQ